MLTGIRSLGRNNAADQGDRPPLAVMMVAALALAVMTFGLLVSPPAAEAKDAEYKYIIPSMKSQADFDKVTAFIKGLAGVKEVTVIPGQHAVVVFFDNDVLDNEKFQLRIPLKNQVGYPVEDVIIMFEARKDEI